MEKQMKYLKKKAELLLDVFEDIQTKPHMAAKFQKSASSRSLKKKKEAPLQLLLPEFKEDEISINSLKWTKN